MVHDYQIQPNSRKCAISGRILNPGERYFSALVEDGPQLVRRDYAHEAWTGPPTGAFGFWTGRVPTPNESLKPRFDDDLLEECFQRLEGQTDQGRVNFRYVVALLLIRRRRFKLEGTGAVDGLATINVFSLRNGTRHAVVDPRLTESEMRDVQDEVFQVLGWK